MTMYTVTLLIVVVPLFQVAVCDWGNKMTMYTVTLFHCSIVPGGRV